MLKPSTSHFPTAFCTSSKDMESSKRLDSWVGEKAPSLARTSDILDHLGQSAVGLSPSYSTMRLRTRDFPSGGKALGFCSDPVVEIFRMELQTSDIGPHCSLYPHVLISWKIKDFCMFQKSELFTISSRINK